MPRPHARDSSRSRSSPGPAGSARRHSAVGSMETRDSAGAARNPGPGFPHPDRPFVEQVRAEARARMDFRNCFGMRASVSMFGRLTGTTSASICSNACIRGHPVPEFRMSKKCPAIAAAAAIAGLTRCALHPRPAALRSYGSMSRHSARPPRGGPRSSRGTSSTRARATRIRPP